MGALFITHFNHKRLLFLYTLELYTVKPDVETVIAYSYSS